jgi:hypothetical protein
MKRMAATTWTDDEVQKLKTYAENGASLYRTAAALGRTASAVKTMAHRHAIYFKSRRAKGTITQKSV